MTAWSRFSPSSRHPFGDVFHGFDEVTLERERWWQQDCLCCRVDPVGGTEVQQRTPVLDASDVRDRNSCFPEDSRDDHAFVIYSNEGAFRHQKNPADEAEREYHQIPLVRTQEHPRYDESPKDDDPHKQDLSWSISVHDTIHEERRAGLAARQPQLQLRYL